MPRPEFSEARYLHSSGFIQLCRDKAEDSMDKRFLSCGVDGDVWVWDTASSLEEGDDVDHKRISDRTHHAVAWHGGDVYVGHTAIDFATNIEKQVVGRMTFPDFTSESPIANFSLDVSTLDVSSSGRLVAAGATDFTVKCIDRTDVNEYKRFECEGPILCVAIDPKEEYLASSSTDGFLRVWPLTGEVTDGRHSLKALKLLPHYGDIDVKKTRAQICWSKDGSYVIVPCAGKVVLIERTTWAQKRTFTVESLSNEMFSICALSSCGQYLAASTLEGHICVWDITSGQLLSSSLYRRDGQPKTICSLIWHPALKDQLVFCDVDEHMCSLLHCLSSSDAKSAKNDGASLFGDADDGDDVIGQPQRKRSVLLDDDEDSKASMDLGAIKARYGFTEDGMQLPVDFGGQSKSTRAPAAASYLAPAWQPPTLPKAFVSGSTPTNLSQRYLKWNHVGIIRMFNTDDESSIEIEFHDVSVHPAIVIDNSDTNYTITDLSVDAVVLAAPGVIEEKCSRINVRHLSAWDQASREWFTDLPKDEDAENVCIGGGWFAVYTSAKNVRIFTIGGIQRTIWTVGGSLLTMCAFGDQLTLATVAYASQVDRDTTEFSFFATVHNIALERSSGSKVPAPTRLDIAVGPKAQIIWLAYSNQGSLCAMDSSGCVRLLTVNGTWSPIFDAQSEVKGPSDHVWPISVNERPLQQLRYIYCKGAKYPLVASRPTPIIGSWKLPLCDQDSEKGQLEEKLLLSEMQRVNVAGSDAASSELNHALLTTVMRMFALACKSDRDCRALEMARLMPTTQGLQMMINYASKSRHSMLSEKVAEVARQRAQDEQETKLRAEFSVDRRDENISIIPRPSLSRSKQRSSSPPPDDDDDDDDIDRHRMDVNDRPLENPLLAIRNQRVSTSPAPITPTEMHTRNPFKRPSQVDIGGAGSIFDSLDDASSSVARGHQEPIDAKRRKDNDGQKKQARLAFNKQANALKSSENNGATEPTANRPTGFQLWLDEKRAELEVKLGGSGGDFVKKATMEFRQLNAAEKKEWNDKAKLAAPTAIDQLSQKSAQLDTSMDSERSTLLI